MKNNVHISLPFTLKPLADDFSELALGDTRLDARAVRIAEAWAASPETSLPKAMKTSADLEGAYRFFRREHVSAEDVVSPHIGCAWKRAGEAANAGWLLSVEDTTELRFGGEAEREGLGALMNHGQGFFLHASLLMCLVDDRIAVPLGLGAFETLVRDRAKCTGSRAKDPRSKKERERDRHLADDNEALRWERVTSEVDATAKASQLSVIHVADREADTFPWMSALLSSGGRFIVRQSQNRRLTDPVDDAQYAAELFDEVRPIRATREIAVQRAATSGGRRRRTAPREARGIMLEIRAVENISFRRPPGCRSDAKHVVVNIVQVREENPPEGSEPIEWRLMTTEAVTTWEDVLRIVDAYRARWLIEELFKALKTGCQYERLQLESLHSLSNALALALPVAWQMLLLRTVARDAPETPGEQVLSAEHFSALRMIARTKKNPWDVKLPAKKPTALDVQYAVARMGGHLKHNGPPGWLTLSRGFQELDRFVIAARIVNGKM